MPKKTICLANTYHNKVYFTFFVSSFDPKWWTLWTFIAGHPGVAWEVWRFFGHQNAPKNVWKIPHPVILPGTWRVASGNRISKWSNCWSISCLKDKPLLFLCWVIDMSLNRSKTRSIFGGGRSKMFKSRWSVLPKNAIIRCPTMLRMKKAGLQRSTSQCPKKHWQGLRSSTGVANAFLCGTRIGEIW